MVVFSSRILSNGKKTHPDMLKYILRHVSSDCSSRTGIMLSSDSLVASCALQGADETFYAPSYADLRLVVLDTSTCSSYKVQYSTLSTLIKLEPLFEVAYI